MIKNYKIGIKMFFFNYYTIYLNADTKALLKLIMGQDKAFYLFCIFFLLNFVIFFLFNTFFLQNKTRF